jgi:hypothetical protein
MDLKIFACSLPDPNPSLVLFRNINCRALKIYRFKITVLNHGKGVCADPGKRDTTLGVGGPGPPERGSEQQLDPVSGGGKT